jgi:hypothetical protein
MTHARVYHLNHPSSVRAQLASFGPQAVRKNDANNISGPPMVYPEDECNAYRADATCPPRDVSPRNSIENVTRKRHSSFELAFSTHAFQTH